MDIFEINSGYKEPFSTCMKCPHICMEYPHSRMEHPHSLYGPPPTVCMVHHHIFYWGWSIRYFLISYSSNVIHLMILMYLSNKPPYPKFTLTAFFFLYVISLIFDEFFSTSSMMRPRITLQALF